MDEDLKKGLKKALDQAETNIAKSILKWRYKKRSVPIPGESELEDKSRSVAGRTNEVLAKRGKNAWKEFKKVYTKERGKGGGS